MQTSSLAKIKPYFSRRRSISQKYKGEQNNLQTFVHVMKKLALIKNRMKKILEF